MSGHPEGLEVGVATMAPEDDVGLLCVITKPLSEHGRFRYKISMCSMLSGPAKEFAVKRTLSASLFSLGFDILLMSLNHVPSSSDEWEAVCSSHGEERGKNFDLELSRYMMQTITDVKYLIKKSKYTAVSK
uniref:Ovate family protein n=1 Tax=Angiostrongylus cantonensis TaxID=6313 RepID=A0A0K0DF08_ANGCA